MGGTQHSQITSSRKSIWLAGIVWLLFLAPFFYLTYMQVNTYTSTLSDVPSFVYSWEKAIPFLPWTIIPYWSVNIAYGISLIICTTLREQFIHGLRLIVASLIACAGFLLFPLKFSFTRPTTEGVSGWLFTQLEGFDLPYNQAPSLHIILLWIIWLRFRAHTPKSWQWLLNLWSLLIAISVLTTWQHHFIDIITGFGVGVFICYLLPINSRWKWHFTGSKRSLRIGKNYALSAIVFYLLSFGLQGFFWIFLWPAITLTFVTLGYLGAGASIFQKNTQGEIPLSAQIILLPYRFFAWCTYRYYLTRCQTPSLVAEGVLLGGRPLYKLNANAVFDLTCEWPRNKFSQNQLYLAQPQIDLLPLSPDDICKAMLSMERLSQVGTVYIHCKLGYSRSATIAVAWLVYNGTVDTLEDAIKQVYQTRPQVILNPETQEALQIWYSHFQQNRSRGNNADNKN
ncbi:phosphatase PAP2/dual specificity phosphatase family protein [Proteus faecis]|uniref:phosphatase PAP2/dual specificity phosphatase family protein n=1 Tax=Proteus faecis TaxID=2050967 RepID=UPI003CF91BD6